MSATGLHVAWLPVAEPPAAPFVRCMAAGSEAARWVVARCVAAGWYAARCDAARRVATLRVAGLRRLGGLGLPGVVRVHRRGRHRCIDHAGQFELHQDHVDEARHRGPAGLDREVSGFAVQRVALRIQLAQAPERIAHLQQRPLRVVAHAAKQFLGHRTQVDDGGPRVQRLAVVGPQHRTATRGQHTVVPARQLIDDLVLELPKRRLALTLEIAADRFADPLFDLGVAVDERQVQPPRQVSPDSGFAAAGQTDESYNYGSLGYVMPTR